MTTHRLTLLVTFLLLILVGCTPASPSPTSATPSLPASSGTAGLEASPSPEVSPTPAASPTPANAQVILLAPADSSSAQALQPVITRLAEEAGLTFAALSQLPHADLAGIRLVVAFPGGEDASAAAQSNPDVHFIFIDPANGEAGENTSLVRAPSSSDSLAFAAGYLAAIITEDWRAGMLLSAGGEGETRQGIAFTNGLAYFCGLCSPAYPPYQDYPLLASLASDASEGDVQTAVNYLLDRGVQTIFIGPGLGSESLYAYLAQKEVVLIGVGAPPAELESQWAASLGVSWEAALQELWPGALAGEPGRELAAPLILDYVNEENLSPGRMRMVEAVLADLNGGYIDTGAASP